MNQIHLQQLTKNYGTTKALNHIDVTLPAHGITGVIGPNGSGKSTLLKIIAGLIRPSSGSAAILGKQAARNLGDTTAYLSEEDSLYGYMTIQQAAAFSASVYPSFDSDLCATLLEEMNLDRKQKIKHLSRGNKARVKLALTMARRTPVLCLDEPLSGMDPLVREDILRLIVTHLDVDKQLCLITSHEVQELEPFLDHVLIVRDGEIAIDSNLDDLREKEQKSLMAILKEVSVDV
ncbi:ABC transporter ATP-binding protein [Salisediminibacterium halotolerans]|uniref:ABC-2 type transport system ATP-binding protein n=1 Tax=Salisediminibacterium halotolerans TaxID=517425 RepID=A0A1H9WTR5_9BACI|nr:ABC transporter ATP-binding protein [Salisediminibacterium haloalkalitolerans]SES37332.1 ABC-2 type transport system ATP-binding protein [Salisediminibacterium haloalkalitolerans]